MKELFLEIGTEEIPAGFVPKALEEMDTLIKKELSFLRIKHGEVKTFGTPRRLVLSVASVAERQEDVSIQVLGPAKKAAFDENGDLTKAAEGFARSQGFDASDLKVVETPKGEYLAVQKEEKGRPTADILEEVLPRLMSSIPFRKSMRWGDLDVRFARPLHWIVALYGGEVVPLTVGDIKSGNESRGHRFMAPASFTVGGLSDYLEKTEKAFVIVEQDRRKAIIKGQVNKLASSVNGSAIDDEELLDIVAFLVESPVALLGGFEKEFLKLPKEVLITSMREHQKYFSLAGKDGELLPHFIAVSNTNAKDMDVVKKGNERVLRARLSDARFFYEEDQKVPLRDRVEKLKGIVFQAKLGTYYDKALRVIDLSSLLGNNLSVVELFHIAEDPTKQALTFNLEGVVAKKIRSKWLLAKATLLYKADLTTGMVGEFPNLQGIMGREYAQLSGEDAEVAEAIYEHYLPRFAGDKVPVTDLGAILSIADRIDTICGCFGIGEVPTGTKDQFAQRRHTIAIINIVLARNYRFSISKFVDKSLELLSNRITRPNKNVKEHIMGYIKDRLKNILTGDGYPIDVVDAVLSVDFDDIVKSVKIVKALSELKKRPDFEPLAIAFKRAVNITKGTVRTTVDTSLFQHPTEKELYEASNKLKERVFALAQNEDFDRALLEVAAIKGAVDAFFDGVLVMDKDEKMRNNRLALLWGVSDIFSGFADFSKIVTTQ